MENEKLKEINEEINEDEGEMEEYYLGKDRDDERKRKAYVTLLYYKHTNLESYVK